MRDHKFAEIINKNNIKDSYSRMDNKTKIVTAQNIKISKTNKSNKRLFNCQNPTDGPLDGKYMLPKIVYSSEVKTNEQHFPKVYLSTSETEIKISYNNHLKSFRNKKCKKDTEF